MLSRTFILCWKIREIQIIMTFFDFDDVLLADNEMTAMKRIKMEPKKLFRMKNLLSLRSAICCNLHEKDQRGICC